MALITKDQLLAILYREINAIECLIEAHNEPILTPAKALCAAHNEPYKRKIKAKQAEIDRLLTEDGQQQIEFDLLGAS